MTKRPSDPQKRRLIKLDEQFRAWVMLQPSCLSRRFSEYHGGIGYSIACHIRRASNAGVGMKPPFSCISLTDSEHKLTHQYGEEIIAPAEWFEQQAETHLAKWMATISPADVQLIRDAGYAP